VLGAVKVGDEITYKISYKNYKSEAATVLIKDKLDPNVEFVSATNGGTEADGVVTWTLNDVPAGTTGTVELTVKVLEAASGKKVVNGGETTTVKVGNDNEIKLNTVENPVPEEPTKEETAPYEGTGVLGAVQVGDEITYKINYKNYKNEKADIVITDVLDKNVSYRGSEGGSYISPSVEDAHGGVVTWTIKEVAAGATGSVTLTVEVLEGALESEGGEGKVVNGGENATVKVGNDNAFELNTVENPVPEEPSKKETAPYEGNGKLGGVDVGDKITYEISYDNYNDDAVEVVIKDKLDANVTYVSSTPAGTYSERDNTVTWTLADVAAKTAGKVNIGRAAKKEALIPNG
jgi:uncharacterized repeat protein (TIGR01451 family)